MIESGLGCDIQTGRFGISSEATLQVDSSLRAISFCCGNFTEGQLINPHSDKDLDSDLYEETHYETRDPSKYYSHKLVGS